MEFFVFSITLFIVIFSTFIQCHKIYKLKSSIGISINAYYLTLISVFMMFITATDFYIKLIAIIEIIFTILSLVFILKFKEQSIKAITFNIELFIPLIFSFFMIFGVAQSIASFKNKTTNCSVSIMSYLLWFSLHILLIYLSTDIYIIIPLVITNCLYTYIMIDSYLKKHKLIHIKM